MEGTNPDATPFFEEVSAAFEEETGATLDIQFVPWASAHDQFTNAIAGGTGPGPRSAPRGRRSSATRAPSWTCPTRSARRA
jgi:hypothetical protein